jgi:methylase of polypeptide subunit release factors
LQKTYEGLHIVCAEVDPQFANSARNAILVGGGGVEVHVSDMTSNIDDKFDIVFMNPPYVSNLDLFKLGIKAGTPEFQAGFVGSEGLEVVEKFLTEVPVVLKSNGVALLGINNLYFPDAEVIRLINKSNFSLIRQFYCIDDVPPFSQVYVLSKKEGR